MSRNVKELEEKIGYNFKDSHLLRHAVTHSSYVNEKHMKKADCNERLEFLGDAVLEVISSDFLFHTYESMPEGEMTKKRASLVCEPALAFCAREIDLGSFLLLGKGEEATGGRHRDSIVSDAMEATIGAIFLDGGFEPAKTFVLNYILNDIEHKQLFYDSKTILQELIQGETDEEIVFNTVDVGSMWLSFFIKAQAGKHLILSTLAKLSEVAIKIKSNYKVTKMQDEWLETMRQKNDVGQEVIDVFKQMKQKMLDDAVSELEGECGISLENDEDRDRARRSIDKMAMLIDKGVEIYSAIETPQEIKVMFPFSENAPLLPEGLQKLIEAKEENNGDETSEQ